MREHERDLQALAHDLNSQGEVAGRYNIGGQIDRKPSQASKVTPMTAAASLQDHQVVSSYVSTRDDFSPLNSDGETPGRFTRTNVAGDRYQNKASRTVFGNRVASHDAGAHESLLN